MNERLKEEIAMALNEVYCGYEGAMMEHDATKDEFRQNEKESAQIAVLVGLSTSYYPFKV
jgi:hypothetical protein